jgi:hypothetical protein
VNHTCNGKDGPGQTQKGMCLGQVCTVAKTLPQIHSQSHDSMQHVARLVNLGLWMELKAQTRHVDEWPPWQTRRFMAKHPSNDHETKLPPCRKRWLFTGRKQWPGRLFSLQLFVHCAARVAWIVLFGNTTTFVVASIHFYRSQMMRSTPTLCGVPRAGSSLAALQNLPRSPSPTS